MSDVISFDSYQELQDSVASFLDRDDLTDAIPGFIKLAEAEINRVLRRTTKRTTITISEESYTLPATVAELRSLHLITSSQSLDTPIRIVTPEMLAEVRARGYSTGRPSVAAVIGGKLVFAPAPDGLYAADMVYFEKLVPLSDSQPTNVLLAEAPDAYLYGALVGASLFLEHDERVSKWEEKQNKALAQLESVREREEYNASLRPARLAVVF